VCVQSGAAPPLLFDYSGFPPETYQLTWPAPGAPALAARAAALLQGAGFATALDGERGFDHGVFVPLKLAFPRADIPALQVSLHGGLDASRHLALGRALAPLRREGALIIGSGFATHNLGEIARGDGGGAPPQAWAQQFDGWLAATLLGRARAPASAAAAAAPTVGAPQSHAALCAALARAPAEAPHFARAHPRTEHLMPLYVALGAALPLQQEAAVDAGGSAGAGAGAGAGAAADSVVVTELFSQIVMGTASLSSYRFD
jgi:aromatic ring-opening dioxygenase catalytic subunit (LigB family)